MPGASDKTRRITILNANWSPGSDGGEGRFELMMVTEDGERHSVRASAASVSAVVALSQAETVLAWDPVNATLIAANIVGTMPWTVDRDADRIDRLAPALAPGAGHA